MHPIKKSHLRHTALLFLFFCCCTGTLVAQNEAVQYKIDSLVYHYYQRCKENVKSPIVLAMSDTLFRMADIKKDQRMQAVAISTKVDYFYYQGTQEDSIIAYVNQVKEFARKTNQPKYYYFIWGKRLIIYYIKQGKINLALFEAEKMLKEAEKEDYKEGIATCYNSLHVIYSMKGMDALTMQFQLKEIEMYEKYQLDNYNISLLYGEASKQYLRKGDPKQALILLQKGEKLAVGDSHKVKIKLRYVEYFIAVNDLESAWEELQESQQAIYNMKDFAPYIKSLYVAEEAYYRETKQYPKTLDIIEKLSQIYKESKEITSYKNLLLIKADTYIALKRKADAADCFKEYIEIEKQLSVENEEITTGEFSTLLNVQQLNAEKNEMTQQAQQKQLHNTQIIIILLVVLLTVALAFFYRENLLNKRLSESKEKLIRKNQTLQQSQEELSRAKELAEQASRMKTAFIQNMSHEIRTPLNSIVGFSQVLTNYFSDNEEAKEFSGIIETNSNILLKLITDVLHLASLDQMNEPMKIAETDINDCCRRSIELTLPLVKEGVLLLFEPPCQKLPARTNSEQLSQVFINLLSNAAKFTNKGRITLSYIVNEAEQTIVFAVSDTGIGITEDQQERVFERFIKLDDFSQGTGLGLSISQMIASSLGGSLVIDATYKEGSRFVLTLPYHPVL